MGRKEGRRIKGGMPMDAMMPFIMTSRVGSSNKFSSTLDIENCEALLRKLRAEGMKGIGMMHIFMAAYIRIVSQYPGMNRFIRGQRLYARNGIEICMTIKKEMKLNAPETVIKLEAEPTQTLTDVYHNLSKLIEENLQDGDQNDMDAVARVLSMLPRFIIRFAVGVLKFFDYYGLLPRWLTKLSPFHGSLFITNLGSLGIPPVFHHLYDFGNLPLFIAFGAKRVKYETNKDGETVRRSLMDFTLVCDERISDGHYFATAFKRFQKIFEHPEQLLEAPETVVEDIQ